MDFTLIKIRLCAIILILSFISYIQCVEYKANKSSRRISSNIRRPKLSFLQLVAPLAMADNCKSSSGLEGVCLSAQDCLKRGGKGIETCAWGLGVCCVHTFSCGGESSANTTYFTSPNYPNAWTKNTGVCTFTLKPRLFRKICQLRLDFEDFYIIGPKAGLCSEMFVATGQDLNDIVPGICGQNSGQHMYLQVESTSGPYRFTVTTSGESNERKWKIRISQIPCGSNALAPPHCLQYFTGSVGSFHSFNYGNMKPEENTYFRNMDYAICIRKEAAMCGAVFTPENFNIDVKGTTAKGCLNHYLSFGTAKKCGVNDTIEKDITYENAGPMILSFVSDNEITSSAQSSDSGFKFRYSQFSCSSRN